MGKIVKALNFDCEILSPTSVDPSFRQLLAESFYLSMVEFVGEAHLNKLVDGMVKS